MSFRLTLRAIRLTLHAIRPGLHAIALTGPATALTVSAIALTVPTIAMTVLALALTLLAPACSVEKPVTPSYQTNLAVPVGDQRISGLDLMHQQTMIRGDSTGAGPMSFVLTGELNDFTVGDLLDVSLPASSSSVALTSVQIPDLGSLAVSYSLHQLAPELPAGPEVLPVPPVAFTGVQIETSAKEGFDWAHLQSGTLHLHIDNGFSVPLAPAQEPPTPSACGCAITPPGTF